MIKKILIPKERLGVVRKNKTKIEEYSNVKITINDEVTLDGEPIAMMDVENVIRAIGRGFSPEKAFQLFDEEKALIIIDLPKEEKTLRRIRARIIGTEGKAKENIERLTDCDIAVFGKTVSIIGDCESIVVARQAVEKLIQGFSHRAVYNLLEKWRRKKFQS